MLVIKLAESKTTKHALSTFAKSFIKSTNKKSILSAKLYTIAFYIRYWIP